MARESQLCACLVEKEKKKKPYNEMHFSITRSPPDA